MEMTNLYEYKKMVCQLIQIKHYKKYSQKYFGQSIGNKSN